MGNYFQGTLTIPLRKDIPYELQLSLIKMCYWQEKCEKPKNWEHEPCFQHKRWDYPNFSYGFILQDETDSNSYNLLEYEGEPLCDEELYPKEMWKFHIGYFFSIDFCMKEYQGLGELYVDWLRPYMDTKFNYLGEIKDEDRTYRKKFYIDEKLVKDKIESRRYLCNGCNYFVETDLCENYTICKRAYELGLNKSKE